MIASASQGREIYTVYSPSVPSQTFILLQYINVDSCKADVCQDVVEYVRVDCLEQTSTPPEQNRSGEGAKL